MNFGVLIENQKHSAKEVHASSQQVLVEKLSSMVSRDQFFLRLWKLPVSCLTKLINLPEKKKKDW